MARNPSCHGQQDLVARMEVIERASQSYITILPLLDFGMWQGRVDCVYERGVSLACRVGFSLIQCPDRESLCPILEASLVQLFQLLDRYFCGTGGKSVYEHV